MKKKKPSLIIHSCTKVSIPSLISWQNNKNDMTVADLSIEQMQPQSKSKSLLLAALPHAEYIQIIEIGLLSDHFCIQIKLKNEL